MTYLDCSSTDYKLVCTTCGKSEQAPALPMALKEWADKLMEFDAKHRRCQPATKNEEKGPLK